MNLNEFTLSLRCSITHPTIRNSLDFVVSASERNDIFVVLFECLTAKLQFTSRRSKPRRLWRLAVAS